MGVGDRGSLTVTKERKEKNKNGAILFQLQNVPLADAQNNQ